MNDPQDWFPLIKTHILRRPVMGPQDVYKLLYQGLLGPEHLIASPDDFINRLQAEWDNLPPGPQESPVESIHPDGRLFRVNLRPYRASGGDLNHLAEACLETAAGKFGTPLELRVVWQAFRDTFSSGGYPGMDVQEMQHLSRRLEENHYPAVHHTNPYRELYRPAYRLVDRKQLDALQAGS